MGGVPTSTCWATLNKTVGGRLVQGAPFARSCFASASAGTNGVFDAKECTVVQKNYLDHFSLTGNLGGYINTQWETCQRSGAQCLLDSTAPTNPVAFTSPNRTCSQGSVPPFAINVSSAQDVLAGFEFSKTYGVPLVVKNTGHDYKGRSAGPGALALWVNSLKTIEHNPQFLPTSCATGGAKENAVTVGAGVTYSDLLAFVSMHNLNLTIPTGGDLTVGVAGGYVQGGGHGILSNVYGLAADRALEFEVVTPSGAHLWANGCQNTDIFWALKGGGGGTFGVVLGMTTKVFDQTGINAVLATFNATVPGQRLAVLQFAADNALQWAQLGWGVYIFPAGGLVLGNILLSPDEAKASMDSLRTFITGNLTGSSFTMAVESTYEAFFNNFVFAIHPDGVPLTAASRLIPSTNFKSADQRVDLVKTVDAAVNLVDLAVVFGTTPWLHGDQGSTSVNPAWYNSLWHVAIGKTWDFNTTAAEIEGKYKNLTAVASGLRLLAPLSGAYVNEADVFEPNWQESFWGSNYPRLLAIKTKYDPDHLLDCWQCVGWLGSGNERYDCYPDI
ncbi:FAD-binding domain-containing protein [Roridomyces roridus]|uniref:FAD-binding domain-containing protein n=1 Tax=Roridomyces roridus TaxID=1738132 RepID=A0AAD7F6Q1_9AGAR|nr:FAD-binding domain-containing protein [Roridomyces roridus]